MENSQVLKYVGYAVLILFIIAVVISGAVISAKSDKYPAYVIGGLGTVIVGYLLWRLAGEVVGRAI